MEMDENLLINPFETNCSKSEKCRESNGYELIQYSEHNHETTRPLSVVDEQCTSGECSENSEQHYQPVLESGSVVYEKTTFESTQQENSENSMLHDGPLNRRLVDFHSSYYDEIQSYIHTKTVPDNASISYKMLLKKRAKNYSIKDGILLYGTKMVLKTKTEQVQALEKTHVERNTGIHLGVKKMSHIINSKWYWRGQYVDIANFVRQCSKCTELFRTSISKEHSKFESYTEDSKSPVHEIWKKVEVHIHGPHSKKNSQLVYIATIVDPVSRYIIARILPTDDFPSHLSLLILETFCTFGLVKCYFGETCTQYLEAVKVILKNQNNFIEKVKLFCQHNLENFLFVLQKGEEQCLWVQSCLEPYITNYFPPCERDLYMYIFELNTNISDSSPFIRMFSRKPCMCSEDDKENTHSDVQNKNNCSRFSQRRLLRCSVLQCRHCEEVFTSKISFRIHQRKHTEEAHRQGMLEGQSRCPGERERRIMHRPLLKYKHLSAKRKSHLQSERNLTVIPVEVGDQATLQADIPEHRRAELRASTVEAVRHLLAKTKNNKKCRGKYKKFSSEIQEQMARYAMDHGSLLTVRHFSEKLGVIVSESTVRNIVKWYQCFTPEVKEEIGRFAATFGIEAAASHFSEHLGREVRFGLIRKFKKAYLSRFTDAKLCKNGKKTDKLKVCSTGEIDSQKKAVLYSSGKKEEMGLNTSDHGKPVMLDNFSEQFKTNCKGNIRKCRKLYKDKQKMRVEQELPTPPLQQEHLHQHQFQHEQSPRELQHQPVHPQIQHDQKQHQHPLPPVLHHNSHNVHQLQHHEPQQMQPEQLHQQQPQQSQQILQQHEPVPCDSGVTLLSVQQHPSDSDLQEAVVQPSSQTIDILQTSLNLLNNPQLNNSAAIIYNTPYQIPSTSHIPSNQLLPMNQQQNSSITFQTTNQCNDSNIPSTVPLSYQSQDVSASVMINQNIAGVPTFPSPQIYPPFAQAQTVQPTALAVSDNSLSLSSQNSHIAPLAHHASTMSSHSGLSTITVAVAPLPSDPHFQATSNQSTVMLSQTMSQPILVSHSQTGTSLLQHIIGSHPHLQTGPAHLPQQMMRDVHPNAGSSLPFAQVVEQQQHVTSASYSHSLNGTISSVPYNAPISFINESRDTSFALPRNANYVQTVEMKEDNGYEQLQSLKSHVAVDKIGEEIESPEKATVPISQLTSQCSSDLVSTEDSEDIEHCEDAALEMKVQSARKNECHRTKQISARKNVKKKDKKVCGKGRNKSNEQKRGTYATYSPEIRAEMGKYAAEYGSQKACVYFRSKHGYNVAESTMRGLRDKYLRKRELYSQDSESEVTSLGYAPRGRPMRLGQYDEVVQECMQELVKSGEKISSFLAIATAKHVLMQYEPHLLEENGGKIKLNVTWAKSFLKRSGIKNYS